MLQLVQSSEVGGLETEPTVLQEVWKQKEAVFIFIFIACF